MPVCNMKKLHPLLLILTPIKNVNVFQKFMPLLITFIAIDNEETQAKEGFCLEIVS